MKRNGFTLAEILITLGIVGVVAALTAPALVKNTAGAKVGPTLAKVVNTMEVANEQLMIDNNISDLSKAYGQSGSTHDTSTASVADMSSYFSDISKYIRKAGFNTDKEVTIYQYNATHSPSKVFATLKGEFLLPEGASIYPAMANTVYNSASYGSMKGNMYDLYVDINGSQSGNNMLGDDVFAFILDRSGAMVPYGSQIAVDAYGSNDVGGTWNNSTNCNKDGVSNGIFCAGSIFENNLKIIYQ